MANRSHNSSARPSNEIDDIRYALFDTAEVETEAEAADHLFMYLGLRTSKVALPKCLQEIKKWRAHTNAVMDIAGLSEDHGDHIVTLEIDLGPASRIANYSNQSVAAWHVINEITTNMHRYQPRLTTQPLDEEINRVGVLLGHCEDPEDPSRSDIDRVLSVLLARQAAVSSRATGLQPVPAKTLVRR